MNSFKIVDGGAWRSYFAMNAMIRAYADKLTERFERYYCSQHGTPSSATRFRIRHSIRQRISRRFVARRRQLASQYNNYFAGVVAR